jgi:hypothetical protein
LCERLKIFSFALTHSTPPPPPPPPQCYEVFFLNSELDVLSAPNIRDLKHLSLDILFLFPAILSFLLL